MDVVKKNYFIWTEAYNCGELLNPLIQSFLNHHSASIHIFASDLDFMKLTQTSNLISRGTFSNYGFINNYIERKVLRKYKRGHAGTAYLWSKIIRKYKKFILVHIDADNIFVGESLSKLLESLNSGDSISGSRRVYLNRSYRLNDRSSKSLNKLPDVVNTDFFGFKTDKIRKYPQWWLRRKITGKRPIKHPCIDFFDPISFEIIQKGGTVGYLDSPNEGKSGFLNKESDFMQKRISFAAVGSGINFSKNMPKKVHHSYIKFALSSYNLYSKFILDKDLGGPYLVDKDLTNKLEKLNKSNWTIL
jgi:hypothetical protein